MKLLFSIVLVTAILVSCSAMFAQSDTLVDVFPLAIGNQWTYKYSVERTDALNVVCWTDTGTVILRVVQQIVSNDSILWGIEQRRYLVRRTAATLCGPPIVISNISDTTTLEIVELLSVQHQLYRTGNWIQYLADPFPYSEQHSDTTNIFRYRRVDQNGRATFRSKPHWMVNSTFTFRKGVGMERYQSTGYPGTGLLLSVDHQLRSSIVLDVDDRTNLLSPRDFALYQNYPNPFNPSTEIRYQIAEVSHVTLKVFDVLGRDVATLVNEVKEAGEYDVQFEATSLSSGVYFYRLTAGSFSATRKLLLMK